MHQALGHQAPGHEAFGHQAVGPYPRTPGYMAHTMGPGPTSTFSKVSTSLTVAVTMLSLIVDDDPSINDKLTTPSYGLQH